MNQERADVQKHEAAGGAKRPFGSFQGGRGPQKEHKRRWLFLLVDVLLLAVIVGAVIFIVSLLVPGSAFRSADSEEKAITYQLELVGVKTDQFTLQVGDAVVDAETGRVIGEVVRFDGRNYEAYTDMAGAVDEVYGSHMVNKITYPEDEYRTITVTVAATADYREGIGYAVEDCRIAIGRSYRVRFASYSDEAVCVGLSEG